MRFCALVAWLMLAAGSAGAGDRARPHPHFEDGGVIPWYTSLAEAKAAAKKQDKLIFIEYGREL